MGRYSWVRELPEGTYVLPFTSDLRDAKDRARDDWRTAVFFESTYMAIDHYERSVPTSPSPGRVYRRYNRYQGKNSQPFVKVVYDHPEGGQIHIPYWVHVIEGY